MLFGTERDCEEILFGKSQTPELEALISTVLVPILFGALATLLASCVPALMSMGQILLATMVSGVACCTAWLTYELRCLSLPQQAKAESALAEARLAQDGNSAELRQSAIAADLEQPKAQTEFVRQIRKMKPAA